MKNIKLIGLITASISLFACNGGGGSSGNNWNSAAVGGGGVSVYRIEVSNNFAYGISGKVDAGGYSRCLSRSPLGENNWSNVRCDSDAIDYAVDENDNVFVVRVATNSGFYNNSTYQPTSVYITDTNNNQIGKTLTNCTRTDAERSSPDYVACVYPPYYGSSQFMATNGNIYFMGNGWIYTPQTSNSATAWTTNVLDYKLNATNGDKYLFGNIYGGGVGSSGTMYITSQWAGVYTDGNWTNYTSASNGGGPNSWNVYTNSELPLDPDTTQGYFSKCSTGSVWEYQNLVVGMVVCPQQVGDPLLYIKTMPKGGYSANWSVVQSVPEKSTSGELVTMYAHGYNNTLYGLVSTQSGYNGINQVQIVLPQIIPN